MNIRNQQMKQVVWLEQANSTFFESVCFVLRNDVECAGGNEMLAEAEKIVAEYVDRRWNGRYRKRRRGFGLGLMLGIVATLCVVAAVLGVIAIFA